MQQLDDLVTPIALYPDPLLGEVLAASTYPLEVVEANQWLLDHPKWRVETTGRSKKKSGTPACRASQPSRRRSPS